MKAEGKTHPSRVLSELDSGETQKLRCGAIFKVAFQNNLPSCSTKLLSSGFLQPKITISVEAGNVGV
jgi:hypothetical protein